MPMHPLLVRRFNFLTVWKDFEPMIYFELISFTYVSLKKKACLLYVHYFSNNAALTSRFQPAELTKVILE